MLPIIPAAIVGQVSGVVSEIKNFLGNLGAKTPHIDFETCSRMVHTLIDDWCAVVVAQTRSEDERRLLAAVAVQSTDRDFYKTYQTGVENLSGVRSTWIYDNWQEATGAKVGMWDLNLLKSTIGSAGVPASKIFADSCWRVGLLAFTNLAPGQSDTVEQRAADVSAWFAKMVNLFAAAVGRSIQAFPAPVTGSTSVSTPVSTPAQTTQTEEIYVAAADVVQSTVTQTQAEKEAEAKKDNSIFILVAVALVAIILLKGK